MSCQFQYFDFVFRFFFEFVGDFEGSAFDEREGEIGGKGMVLFLREG